MKHLPLFAIRVVAALAVSLVLASCGDSGSGDQQSGGSNGGAGGGGNGSGVQATYSNLWNSTFSSCGVNCHSPSAADGTENGPDLSSKGGFYANLVGKTVNKDYPDWANFKNGNCNDIPFIQPGDAAGSTVVTSLIESYSVNQTSCTSSYNLHVVEHVEITDSEIQNALVDWITEGAANN